MAELAHPEFEPLPDVAVGERLAPASERIAELRALSRALVDLLAEIEPAPGTAGGTPAQAFGRLLTGTAHPNDPLMLSAPVSEARVAVVRTGADRAHEQVGRLLDDLPRVVVTATSRRCEWAVFLPTLPRRAGDQPSRSGAQLVFSRACAVTKDARVGVSTPLDGPTDFPRALDEARAAACRPGQGLVLADDAWAEIALLRLRDHVAAALPGHNPLRRLAELDAETDRNFGETLAVWLRADGDARTAAAELGIHVNTLRYRISRLQELTSLDLGDPDARLLAHLVLS